MGRHLAKMEEVGSDLKIVTDKPTRKKILGGIVVDVMTILEYIGMLKK